jgi:hypothetical protein
MVSVIASGTNSVSCAAGKQTLGCHIDPLSTNAEPWRKYVPLATGNGCTCFDTYSAKCTATCAANIKDYELVVTSGKGYVVAICSDSTNRVLGCGIDPSMSAPDMEGWRTAKVLSGSSCQCYDSFETKCYAVCGNIWS